MEECAGMQFCAERFDRIEGKLDKVLEDHATVVRDNIAHNGSLYGNGKDGLMIRVDRLEQARKADEEAMVTKVESPQSDEKARRVWLERTILGTAFTLLGTAGTMLIAYLFQHFVH